MKRLAGPRSVMSCGPSPRIAARLDTAPQVHAIEVVRRSVEPGMEFIPRFNWYDEVSVASESTYDAVLDLEMIWRSMFVDSFSRK